MSIQAYIVTPKNQQAMHILKELQAMDVLEMVPATDVEALEKARKERIEIIKGLSGSISKETGAALNKHIEESRKGWSNRDI